MVENCRVGIVAKWRNMWAFILFQPMPAEQGEQRLSACNLDKLKGRTLHKLTSAVEPDTCEESRVLKQNTETLHGLVTPPAKHWFHTLVLVWKNWKFIIVKSFYSILYGEPCSGWKLYTLCTSNRPSSYAGRQQRSGECVFVQPPSDTVPQLFEYQPLKMWKSDLHWLFLGHQYNQQENRRCRGHSFETK